MELFNQCDLFCPRKAYSGARYREQAARANPFRKVMLVTALGVAGTEQVFRSAHCPVGDDPAENWQPNEACVDAVRAAAAEHPLRVSDLTEDELRVLGSIIGQEPPAAEQ